MLILTCPVCGAEGDETEYTYGHQAHIERPAADKATPESWEKYLFERENKKGLHAERWLHANGCGKWFHALRDTVTMQIVKTYGITEKRPEV